MQELLSLCVKEHLIFISSQKMLIKSTFSLPLPEYVLFESPDILTRENNISLHVSAH